MTQAMQPPTIKLWDAGARGGLYVFVNGEPVNERWTVAADTKENEICVCVRPSDVDSIDALRDVLIAVAREAFLLGRGLEGGAA